MERALTSLRESLTTKAIDFNARSRRYEYFLLLGVYLGVCLLATRLFGEAQPPSEGFVGVSISYSLSFPVDVILLALGIPVVSCAVRRLHDAGYSGWVLLMGLIPCVGWIIVLYMLAEDTKPYPNKWGPDPNAVDDDADLLDHLRP